LGETYNVGPDQPTSIREVVRLCIEATGASFEEVVEIVAERTGQDSCYWLDSSKLKALGWKQEISLPEGIRMVLDWVKSYPELLEMDTSYFMRA
jgi:nucleoside-diphosphate-sugar epimerase